jgi:hypothetical protein
MYLNASDTVPIGEAAHRERRAVRVFLAPSEARSRQYGGRAFAHDRWRDIFRGPSRHDRVDRSEVATDTRACCASGAHFRGDLDVAPDI